MRDHRGTVGTTEGAHGGSVTSRGPSHLLRLRVRVQGLGFGVWGLGFRVSGFGVS